MLAQYLIVRGRFRGQAVARILPAALVAVVMLAVGGCASMNPMSAVPPQQQAQNLDSMLQAAGFTPLTASTPQQK